MQQEKHNKIPKIHSKNVFFVCLFAKFEASSFNKC